jgi:ABC-type polysaccharide/polyol phosphate transport system ATPase subunit/ABC-type polysaccharide/polyol phosphate export permease
VIEPQAYRLPEAADPAPETEPATKPPPAAVSVDGVGKTFLIPEERYSSFTGRAAELFRPHRDRTLRSLDRVSFEVQRGEFFGVVGPNGSGKSTLLKCIAGIYTSDSGSITVSGRLSPFLEMGIGFKEELTASQNVVLNGTLLGLSKEQIRQRMDDIIAFADLEEFANMNLKNFSSGMRVRLAFSLAIQVDADILLLDEVLAVGDEAFMEKCFEEFRLFKEEGRTVLLVTHSMATVNRFCDRALLLDAGRVARIGDPAAVADDYSELNARLGREREEAHANRELHPVQRRRDRGRQAFSTAGKPTTYRPSAFGDDWRRFAAVTTTLAKTEFRVSYRGSVLGYLWSVMQPLMLFTILYAVFSGIVGIGGIKSYPLYVLSAVVLWTFFSESANNGVGSLIRGQALLRKMRFPALAIPLSVSLKALFNLGLNSVVVLGFALASGIGPRLSWLELPALLVLLVAVTAGVTVWLSALHVRYRDTEQMWRVLERGLFFATPIFYAATQYPSGIREIAAMTPFVMIFSEMRHAFIDPSAPSAADLAGGAGWLLVPVAISAAVLGIGLLTFKRHAARIAEQL